MKKNLKKLFLLMAVVVTAVVCIAFEASAETCYTYRISNGNAIITDVDTSISGNVTVPSTLGGYSVTTIGLEAFYNCTGLTSITIPDSVTTIGSDAFYNCTGLTSIALPDSVTTIGSSAFKYCTGLTSIALPDGVTTIGSSAFKYCTGLTSITIPDSVTTIGSDAFYNCTGLTSIALPDSVTTIGSSAFKYCTGLTSITIPDSVTTIDSDAFYNCTGLTSIIIPDSVTTIGSSAFKYCTGLTSIALPDSVTLIDSDAFYNCTGLQSVTFGNGVKTIGKNAFLNCNNLVSLKLPDSVISIGESAFKGCTKLSNIEIGDNLTFIGRYAFSDTAHYNTSANWENGVLYISNNLIEAKSSVSGFYEIKDGTKCIAQYAFSSCTGVEFIAIPEGATSIGDYAFEKCTKLMMVNISSTVTNLGYGVFEGCKNLIAVVYFGSLAKWQRMTFFNDYYRCGRLGSDASSIYCNVHYFTTEITEEPTCMQEGWYLHTCTCPFLYVTVTTEIPKLEHSYSSSYTVDKGATCFAEGLMSKHCITDGCTSKIDEISIEKIEHSYSSSYTTDKKATCSAEGSKSKHCTRSGCTTKTSVIAIAKLAHTYSYACDKSCNACGATRSVSHIYKTTTTKATLSKNGKIESKCSCGKVKSTQTIAKISSVTLSATKYIHDGNNKTPKVTVKDANGNKLVKNVDYKTSVASKRSGIGKYTVKVTFIGKYEGTKNVYFTILPGKPATVKASSQTTSSVKLTWSKVSSAAGYTVYRYSPSKKAYVKAGTTTGTSLTVKKLYDGTKYTFKVVAYGKTSGGKVYNSEGYTLLKTATKTKTPAISKITTTKGKAVLTHTNVSGETGYTVYYSTKKDSGFKKYNNFKADTTTCNITKLTSGRTYYFKVRTYIKTDSGYVYSPWSTVKGIKVK